MKIKFGLSGYMKPTPKKMKRISAFVETLFATLGASSLFAGSPHTSAVFLIIAGISNKFFEMFYEEDDQPTGSGDIGHDAN